MLEKPPTTKNTGMTWSTQVASHSQGVRDSTLPATRPCAERPTAIIVQWPSTTVTMLRTRRKSTYRSRPGGVASASARGRARKAGPRRGPSVAG
ncbi:MAG TPA: hypothetical protein VE776_14520, partial [Actinomycetota bacterium]|nr:hypothetical protein [Actinomycetota bacterium]